MIAVLGTLGRRAWVVAPLSCAAIALTGCQRLSSLGFDTQSAFGSVGFADRCIDFVNRAFPDAGFDITDRRVDVAGNDATVAIAAVRSDVPANGRYAREIGAECRFENGILTGFRWTAGPLRPPDVGQAP